MESPSPSYAPNPFAPSGGLSIKATVLYIGLSMATLLLILIAFMLALVLCLNPRRRRREALELSARQQREEEQRKLEEETNFTPKRTQLPVIIIMPTGECEYGRKISVECLDKEAAEKAAGISSRTNDLEHPEDKPTSYYLRGKHPHYFEAHVQPCKKPEET